MLEYVREIWTRMKLGGRQAKYTVWYVDSPDRHGIRSLILGDLALRRYDCDELLTEDQNPQAPVTMQRNGENSVVLVHSPMIVRMRVNYGYAEDAQEYEDTVNRTPVDMKKEIESIMPQVTPEPSVTRNTMYG